MSTPAANRLKRLRLRSWRRGTREMDLLLGRFADAELAALSGDELEAYEALLSEDDGELYGWLSKPGDLPAQYAGILERIAAHHRIG